jgi:hypothetical protein
MPKQVDQIQQVSGIAEFLPLLKVRSGLKVPKNDLRVAVITAIELLRSTGSTGRSTLDLINSVKFLREEIKQNPTHNYE